MRERAYNAVKNAIVDITKHPNKRAITDRAVRTKLVAHGELDPESYQKALRALVEQDEVIQGETYLTPVVDSRWITEAIEYVAEHSDNPSEFVANANKVKP
jgi:hypothetical protein